MSGILVNTAKVANGEVENAQAIITAQDADRKGFASFEFGNFFNSSVPVLKNYSEFEVNGSLSRFQSGDETVKYLGNSVGATLEDATNAPQNVLLYLCILPYTANTFEFVLRGNIAVAYDNAFGGIYENGTTTRVIGGCVFTGSAWVAKWAINNSELLMTGSSPFIRMFADGLNLNIRKIVGANQLGIVDTPISNYEPTASDAAAGIIPTSIPIQYPCALHVWVRYASSPSWKIAAIGEAAGITSSRVSLFGDDTVIGIGLEKLHTDGTWIKYGEPVKIFGFNSTYNNKSVIIPIHGPGTYRIAPVAGYRHNDVSGNQYGNIPAFTYAPGISIISASIVSVFGSKVDY